MANLKSQSIPELLKLRSEIDAALSSRRSELQAQLAQIGGGSAGSGTDGRSARKGKKVAAKYRHPKTGQEWSGRGGMAKWLAAEVKSGKKKESFLIK